VYWAQHSSSPTPSKLPGSTTLLLSSSSSHEPESVLLPASALTWIFVLLLASVGRLHCKCFRGLFFPFILITMSFFHFRFAAWSAFLLLFSYMLAHENFQKNCVLEVFIYFSLNTHYYTNSCIQKLFILSKWRCL
jgi:hypothetical protein